MKSPFFYQPEISRGVSFLSSDESKHAVRVLRLKEGDRIHVSDGKGKIYDALLTHASKEKAYFEILNHTFYPKKDYTIHIALALTKNIQRVEWFVEKAVEVGIDEFTFMTCLKSERKTVGIDRLIKKSISAMKQSEKAWVPIFNPLKTFQEALHHTMKLKLIAHSSLCNKLLQYIAKPALNYFVMIGPEGDFAHQEIALAEKKGFQSVSLGPHRLRTETAGLVACHTLNLINQ